MLTSLSLTALALLPSANALVRKDGVVWQYFLHSTMTRDKLLTDMKNRVDYQPWDGIAGMPSAAMSILQRS
jgi:hypothetical protein